MAMVYTETLLGLQFLKTSLSQNLGLKFCNQPLPPVQSLQVILALYHQTLLVMLEIGQIPLQVMLKTSNQPLQVMLKTNNQPLQVMLGEQL
jgi:hypothetical protein